MTNRLALTKQFRFEASHVLPKHPGKCSHLHGHSWVLDVTIDGPLDPETGFVVDYGRLKEVVEHYIIDVVDHQHLGQNTADGFHPAVLGDEFYPSSENLVRAFVRMIRGPIQALRTGVDLLSLRLHETCTCAATWSRTFEESEENKHA